MTAWRKTVAVGLGLPALLSLAVTSEVVRAEQEVDLELVLAVDVSSSVDDAEFDLQMRGLAAAFRHPTVVRVLTQAGLRGIAIALVQWAAGKEQLLGLDWTLVRDAAGAAALARRIAATPRLFVGGDTSLGGAIRFSARQFENNGYRGLRRVIDVSGDGGAGQGQEVAKSISSRGRDFALAQGITVNGLAILDEDPDLDVFYRKYVIGGAGAFVIAAESYRDFASAIIEKLIREIGDRPLAEAGPEVRVSVLKEGKRRVQSPLAE
jgi:hypothetical protein